MHRVTIDEGTDGNPISTYDPGDKSDGSNMGNYMSLTVWDEKSDFSAWRKGDAFKEAHGGMSIGAFMSIMIFSAMILNCVPHPVFYDALLMQSTPTDEEDLPETLDGWRNVKADGKIYLQKECFIAQNQLFVSNDIAVEFEQRWAKRESKLKDCEGFVAFSMMRRDTTGKGHGVVPMDVERNRRICRQRLKWRKRTEFKKARGAKTKS